MKKKQYKSLVMLAVLLNLDFLGGGYKYLQADETPSTECVVGVEEESKEEVVTIFPVIETEDSEEAISLFAMDAEEEEESEEVLTFHSRKISSAEEKQEVEDEACIPQEIVCVEKPEGVTPELKMNIEEDKENNLFNSRAITEKEKIALYQERDEKNSKVNPIVEAQKMSKEDVSSLKFYKGTTKQDKKASATYYNRYYSTVSYAHLYPEFSVGNSITLSDGSVWMLENSNYNELWLPTDRIIITPNHGFTSSYTYPYMMVNLETGKKIKTKLHFVPYENNYYSQRILYIDYFFNTITLENGSVWKMPNSNSYILNNWFPGDKVIIGIETSIWAGSYANILINPATNTHVQARVIN